MSPHDPLIGSVIERTTPKTPSAPSPNFTGVPTGFPTAQHRFKSAFARAREEAKQNGSAHGANRHVASVSEGFPSRQVVLQTPPITDTKSIPTVDTLRRQIHEENARRIGHMSEEEIADGKRTVLEQLGQGTEALLRRVQDARRRREAKEMEAAPEERTAHAPPRALQGLASKPGVLRVKSLENIGQSAPLSDLPTTSITRPSSRTGRKLRFAEVTPDDVYVYESAPRSPKRTALALPPPPDTKDDSIASLGTFKNAIPFKQAYQDDSPTGDQRTRGEQGDDEPEEGTPEYIRKRFFPGVPVDDPSLAWMESPSRGSTDPSVPRFDLHGVEISALVSASLPSHLGLHHHAEGSHAGYTIDDIFLLSRSTVPAQRASMLGILAVIAHRLGQQVRHPDNPDKISAFVGQEGEFRKRILAAGLAAIDQIGSLGARAVEVVWECLVGWDDTTSGLEGVELDLAPDVVALLQLDYFLPQVTQVFSHVALPPESLAQLLSVVHWLARQSNKTADVITSTPRLVPTILTTFLLTPIPPREDSLPPNPLALQLLITLASASRSNALALLDPADALLRFVTLLPPSSPYPFPLASALMMYTIRFYATLASYGLYSHIATTAPSQFTTLASYVLSVTPTPADAATLMQSVQLRTAWASLVEAWVVCATDPHATSPPHEILWSQITAWGWTTDVRKLREGLGNKRSDWTVYAAMWDTEAAWLEGARINSIKGGETEREEALQILCNTFAAPDGTEFRVIQRALDGLRLDLARACPTTIQDGKRVLESLATGGNVIASALRLFLACLPPVKDGIPSSPPFALPFSGLSALSATLVKHPIWSLPLTLNAAYLQVYLRPLTRLIVLFHRVSRFIPGTTPQLWFAQALVFLSRLLPGDEPHALDMLDAFYLVTPEFVGIESAELPKDIPIDVLRLFFEYTVRPEVDIYIAPLQPNPESISRSSTLCLPSPQGPGPGNDPAPAHAFTAGLPLTRDVLFTPLTHLLRSGTSPVFQGILPAHWSASEVDVVRATLLLALAARRTLVAHGLEGFVHSASETVFACMRVCMLEHGVGVGGTDTDTDTEVFRDTGVERLMRLLLAPWTLGRTAPTPGPDVPVGTLDAASRPYLGTTPLYAFYTDLMALYGAVSFGHGLFAALVVAPLAMPYAVDYRRALWCGGDGSGGGGGLSDVVWRVRVPVAEVVCTCTRAVDPREYLYPVERDVGVLGAYVAALVVRGGGGLDGFLRLVAVHHVACTVWGDLDPGVGEAGGETETETETGGREKMRVRWLRWVLVHGDADVVRDVVLYRQRWQGAFVWPPMCYRGEDEVDGRWREDRVAFVRRSLGEGAAERVGVLLVPTTK